MPTFRKMEADGTFCELCMWTYDAGTMVEVRERTTAVYVCSRCCRGLGNATFAPPAPPSAPAAPAQGEKGGDGG